MKKRVIVSTIALFATTLAAIGASTDKAAELIKGFEGFRPSVYKCEAGKGTIGYGFTSADMIEKKTIKEDEASVELSRICEDLKMKLRAELGKGNTLLPHEEAAVISLIYNIGWTNFKKSKMCRLLKEGRRGAVIGVEFRKWIYITKNGKKVISKGLAKRRDKEIRAFLIGRC